MLSPELGGASTTIFESNFGAWKMRMWAQRWLSSCGRISSLRRSLSPAWNCSVLGLSCWARRFIQDCGAFPGSCVELVLSGRRLFLVSFFMWGSLIMACAICVGVRYGLGDW